MKLLQQDPGHGKPSQRAFSGREPTCFDLTEAENVLAQVIVLLTAVRRQNMPEGSQVKPF